MSGFALRASRLTLYLIWTVPLMPLQAALVALGSPWAKRLPMIYHRVCCRIMGFRLELRGRASDRHPTLFVGQDPGADRRGSPR